MTLLKSLITVPSTVSNEWSTTDAMENLNKITDSVWNDCINDNNEATSDTVVDGDVQPNPNSNDGESPECAFRSYLRSVFDGNETATDEAQDDRDMMLVSSNRYGSNSLLNGGHTSMTGMVNSCCSNQDNDWLGSFDPVPLRESGAFTDSAMTCSRLSFFG